MTTTTGQETPEPAVASSRDRFIDAALDLMTEHGFSGTSLQMIGDRLDVSKAAVYYHFRSKDELLAAIVEPAFADLARLIEGAEAVPREGARRKQALGSYIDYLIRHRRVAAWLSRDGAAVSNPVVWEPAQGLSGRIDAMLTSTIDDPTARAWGAAITQALTGPVLTDTDLNDEELRVELEHIGACLIRGYQAIRRRRRDC